IRARTRSRNPRSAAADAGRAISTKYRIHHQRGEIMNRVCILFVASMLALQAQADPISMTMDANGLVTQIFFDETELTEAAKAAHIGMWGPGSFDVNFHSAHIPALDSSTVFILKPWST